MISSAAPGSAATRARPSRRASISCASTSPSTSRVSGIAPSAATRPVSSLRVVTTTSEPGAPGSSGRTWATLRALSRTISICLSSSRLRNSAERPSVSAGIRCGGTPSASRNKRSASAGSIGGVAGSRPRRLTYSWPPGNRLATWWPNLMASAVFPVPAVPERTTIGTVGPESCWPESCWPGPCWPGSAGSIARRMLSSSRRPEKPGASSGSWAGTGVVLPSGLGRRCPPSGAGSEPASSSDGADPLAPRIASPFGTDSAGSMVRTCWWMRDRSPPGSMPSSSASTRRPSANTRSASACRPQRYSATISSPRIRSRSG